MKLQLQGLGTLVGTFKGLQHAGCKRALCCPWPCSPEMRSSVGPSQRMYRRCVWVQLPAPSPVYNHVSLPLLQAISGMAMVCMAPACCMSCLELVCVQPHGPCASEMLDDQQRLIAAGRAAFSVALQSSRRMSDHAT